MGGLLFPNQSHCYCFFFFATVVFSRNNCPARGQPETTKSSSRCEITLVISEHVYTALFSITKKKNKKERKGKEREKKNPKTNKDLLASLVVCGSGHIFCLAASAVSGPVIPSKWEGNVVCPHHERAAAEMRNRPTASHRLTWQAAWHHLAKMDCHFKMVQSCPVLAGLSLEGNNWLSETYSMYFHFVLVLAAVLFFCGWQRLVGSVSYLQTWICVGKVN